MKQIGIFSLAVLVFVVGCSTRSISNSGYQSGYYGGHSGRNHLYQGELSEFQVLGIDSGKEYSDQEIAEAFQEQPERIELQKGQSLVLIQSGAMIPDQEMVEQVNQYFTTSLFTGIPETNDESNKSYSDALRYAAARGGHRHIIVYWGVLESGTRNLATKTVSWVPIVGWGLPDEAQEMRIRLKVAVLDVKSGHWEMITPEVFGDRAYSARATRASSDQSQVLQLKSEAYTAAVQSLLTRYVR